MPEAIKPASRENYRQCTACSIELGEEVLYHVKALQSRQGFFDSEKRWLCPRGHDMPDPATLPAPA